MTSLGEPSIPAFPFTAIVGQSQAKLALLLLAIDRRLKGVLIASPYGSAKSSLARAAKSIFIDAKNHPVPFVDLPVGVSEARLLGGLDFERTLKIGSKQFATGLLAEANGGVVYADEAAWFDANITSHLATALDNGVVQIEREGLSLATGADFVFIGSFSSDVGEIPPLLRERVGLIVEMEDIRALDERAEIAERVLGFEKDPERFCGNFESEKRILLANIEAAKNRLPHISISTEDLKRIAGISLSLGVEGNRADMIAARAARAHAAMAARDVVNEDDLIAAIQLVLLPRATSKPGFEEQADSPGNQPQEGSQINQPESSGNSQIPNEVESPAESRLHQQGIDRARMEDLLIKAIEARLPKDFLQAQVINPKSKIQNPKSASGKRVENANRDRGRTQGIATKKRSTKKVAIAATIRAAAPFQKARRRNERGQNGLQKIVITPDDLRYKKFRHKSGILFIFAVDASGSMALNRCAQAKGAMTRLLQEAYIHRDKVAMLTFRGNRAEVLLPPTRSVELAKRLVDAIPTGGTTPLAMALMKALEVAGQAHSQGISQIVLLLFTDGRANISAKDMPVDSQAIKTDRINNELKELGVMLNRAGITAVVIDTKAKFLAGGDASSLADLLGAKYLYLPRADDSAIYESLRLMGEDVRL
jgi:magnesium chelatase subunit D